MSQSNLGIKTFPTGGTALGQFLRVKTPSSLALAGATDPCLGTMLKPTFTTDSVGAVLLSNNAGTRKMVASGAITAGNPVFAGASGKIASSGSLFEGVALEAATADGDIIEVATNIWDVVGKVLHVDTTFTIAQVNAGATLLAAMTGLKYKMVDASMIAIGGNTATATTIDLLGTQSSSSVKLVANAVAGLTQNTLLRAGATNSTILAAGASFGVCDANTAITINKTGSDATAATSIRVLFNYIITV